MGKLVLKVVFVVLLVLVAYLLFWPVPIEPVAFSPPDDLGHTGPHAANDRLAGVETLSIGDTHGPEDVALDADGRIYAATGEGYIVRLDAAGGNPENWVKLGRPLGIDFDAAGNLIVADAYRGLVSVAPDGQVEMLADIVDNIPVRYADDVDVGPDGVIYFSDASTKFGAEAWGGTYPASLLDLMEHGLNGRLLAYDPETGKARTLLAELSFANGVAVAQDGRSVLVNETGNYRTLRYHLVGPKAGETEVLADNYPGFPDNISQGQDGRYWVALISPRNAPLDQMADIPFVRKVVQRLPAVLRPKAVPHSHIVVIDEQGRVIGDYQDPAAGYASITSVHETDEYIYLGSLFMPVLGRVAKARLGL